MADILRISNGSHRRRLRCYAVLQGGLFHALHVVLHGNFMHVRSIDGLRGIAVLGVLAYHVSGGALRDGARGVDLFFVISGFCLGLHALERRFNLVRFARARAWRILPPYYAAILLGIVLAVGDGRITIVHALSEGLRNAFFMSEWGASPTINSNFWTILIEARWYVYFPLVLWIYTRSKWTFASILVACAFGDIVSAPWMDREVLPAFMLGIVASDLVLRKMPIPFPAQCAAGTLLIALLCDARGPNSIYIDHGNFLWQMALFLVVIAGIRSWGVILDFTPLAFLGRISYSVYLAQETALEMLSPYNLAPSLLVPLILLWSFAFYRAFERPFLMRKTSYVKTSIDPTPKSPISTIFSPQEGPAS